MTTEFARQDVHENEDQHEANDGGHHNEYLRVTLLIEKDFLVIFSDISPYLKCTLLSVGLS